MHSIDFSQVRCHVEFNADETEAVMNRPTGLTCAVLTVLGHVIFTTHNFQNCFMELLSTESFFRQLNNRYVGKQQYNPLNAIYF